jgi:tRNA (adenine37-N6)-methyltransferase
LSGYQVSPIGFVRSPFVEKGEVPRQAVAEGAKGVPGTVEVLREHADALSDLDGFDRIWILFWFHEVGEEQRKLTKVLPPRSEEKRGVFATRSPHRPNPIGMSAVRLERIEGLVVHFRDLDLIEGTPVLDLKPYIPYADAFPDARTGWLEATDPRPEWIVRFTEEAEKQLAWLRAQAMPFDLRARIAESLALGPQPHAYRRIKQLEGDRIILAVKEWRARCDVDQTGHTISVASIESGYRPGELESGKDPALALHRAFASVFG